MLAGQRVRAGARLRLGHLRASAARTAGRAAVGTRTCTRASAANPSDAVIARAAVGVFSRAVAIGVLVVSITGCSVLKTQSPRPYPNPPACRQSRGPAVIDLVGAIFGAPVAAVLVWVYADNNNFRKDTQSIMVGGTLAGWFAVAIGSSILGFSRTGRCQEAYLKYEAMTPRPPPLVEPLPGTERGRCRPDATCMEGLTCASNRCVLLPPPATGM